MYQRIAFFVLTAICVPWTADGAGVPREIFLACLSAIVFWRIILPWTAYVLLALLALEAYRTSVGYDAALMLWVAVLYTVLFCWRPDMRNVAIGAGLGMCANSVAVLLQYAGYHFGNEVSVYPGLFFNSNWAAVIAAPVFVLCIGYELWWIAAGIAPTLLLGSRTAAVAVGVAALVGLWKRSPFAAIMAALSCALLAVTLTHRGGMASIDYRLNIWRDVLPALTFWGHGLGSFLPDFPAYQVHTNALNIRFAELHNDYLQILFELGVGGAAAVVILVRQLSASPRSPAFYALVAFMTESCFDFPLYQPVAGALFVVVAADVFHSRCVLWDDVLRGQRVLYGWYARLRDQSLPVGRGSFSLESPVPLGLGLGVAPDRRPRRDPGPAVGAAVRSERG
jgi:O-antigen ligase/polysaccharide polymerase Wzy-like membrane protein